MMLKTVYGPPPADRERIEATTEDAIDGALVRETTEEAATAADLAKAGCPAAGLDRQPE
ncbi:MULTISPECIES: hypothetical protein [Sporomusaceae]|uniref:Uncharacterized protein n=1 Tax=Pelosinus propionicus DSM 13327 TaxID=1123291 RepID=A0A1I4MCY3_9FIRM|nr:hypothetical protein [Pelosinus propionicus]SFM00933.1 hypothetical protein SAMN04490355_103227 [Pelosinus propionicus DSM 13327]